MNAFEYQRLAKEQFEADKYRRAFQSYVEAVAAFGAAELTNWIRAFFCDASALRCLERLASQDAMHLPECLEYLEQFCSRWSPDRIKDKIKDKKRQGEALETFDSRITLRELIDAKRDIVEAKQNLGDFGNARAVLRKTISDLEAANAFPTRLSIIKQLTCFIALVDVAEEYRKPLAHRDFNRIVASYLSAAQEARTADDRDYLGRLLKGFAHYYRHRAVMVRVNMIRHLEADCRSDFSSTIKRIADRLHVANRLLQMALSTEAQGIIFPLTRPLVGYRAALATLRAELHHSLQDKDLNRLHTARCAHEEAVSYANEIAGHKSLHLLFPGQYDSLDDLSNEKLIIDANQYLIEQSWENALAKYEEWLNRLPASYEGSWRHAQARIRVLYLQSHIRCLKGATTPAPELIPLIRDARRFHRPGRYGEALLLHAEAASNEPLPPGTAEKVLQDLTYAMSFATPSSILDDHEIFQTLQVFPNPIAEILQSAPDRNAAELRSWKNTFFAACEILLKHMSDYYEQVPGTRGQDVEIQLPRSGSIRLSLPRSIEKKARDHFTAIGKYLKSIDQAHVDDIDATYEKTLDAIQIVSAYFPVVATCVGAEHGGIAQPESVKLKGQHIKLIGKVPHKGQFYLHPSLHYRPRPFFRVEGRFSIFPVRYEPDWDALESSYGKLVASVVFEFLAKDALREKFGGEAQRDFRFTRREEEFSVDCHIRCLALDIIAECKMRFRTGLLTSTQAVDQAADYGAAYSETFGRQTRTMLVSNSDVSEAVIRRANERRVDIWRATLNMSPRNCLENPGKMRIQHLVEVFSSLPIGLDKAAS